MAYEPRRYRESVSAQGLVAFEVVVAETDLQILARQDLTTQAFELVHGLRTGLESYIASHPRFAESFVPVPVDSSAPPLAVAMADGARAAGVGPMAGVAGGIAQRVAEGLRPWSDEVIVENGGDTYLVGRHDRLVALWAGDSGARGVGLRIKAAQLPCAVATSSGKVGHSTSFGAADSVTILSRDGALADAVATATANRLRDASGLPAAVEFARAVPGITGVFASAGGSLAAWGAVELVPIDADLA